MNLYNQEYEKAVLGSLLLDNDNLEKVDQYISGEDFYLSRNKMFFEKITSLIGAGEEVNILSLSEKLPGQASEIAQLTDIPTSANVEFFCKQLRDLSIRRRVRLLMQGLQDNIQDKSKNVEDVVEHIETELTTILNKKSWAYKRIGEFIHPALEHIEKLLNSQGILGISTGYSSIDDYTGGFIDSEVTIIGARASMGKTAIALNMAENISKQNIPVGFISLEMQGKLLALRILCGLSKIDMWKIRAGMIDRKDFDRLYDAGRSINEYPLYLYEYPNARLLDIKLKARLMKRQEGIKILFIDYIGLIRTDQDTPRWEEVGYISSELKALARELEIPIVVCCQVNRDAEGKPPTLANLRESGSIEQDADVVMFLHRKRDSQNSELIISKNRNGGTGKIDLYFIMERTRFEEVTREIA